MSIKAAPTSSSLMTAVLQPLSGANLSGRKRYPGFASPRRSPSARISLYRSGDLRGRSSDGILWNTHRGRCTALASSQGHCFERRPEHDWLGRCRIAHACSNRSTVKGSVCSIGALGCRERFPYKNTPSRLDDRRAGRKIEKGLSPLAGFSPRFDARLPRVYCGAE
jgi:hypothetical protein